MADRLPRDPLSLTVLAANLLSVTRIAVVQHTDCAMTKASDEDLRARIAGQSGGDAEGWEFLTIPDQDATLLADVQLVRDCPLIPGDTVVAGFVYDVFTGALRTVA